MKNMNTVRQGYEGRLPAMAPLANPYVPFQMEDPPRYEAGKAVVRGTLFPGLDLPFMGMVNNKELPATPLAELQTLSFALQELALYLDTHRGDREALMLFNTMQKLLAEGRKRYEEKCGPLTHMSPMVDEFSWIRDPWPWEYCANREV